MDGVSVKSGSILAALSHVRPVITTRSYKVELYPFIDMENVLLVPPRNQDQLAQAIGELVSSVALREKIGANGHKLSKCFSWNDIANRHIQEYNKVVFFAKR